MKALLAIIMLVGGVAAGAVGLYAMTPRGGADRETELYASYSGENAGSPAPAPLKLYAVGCGVAVLATAGWYIRRRM